MSEVNDGAMAREATRLGGVFVADQPIPVLDGQTIKVGEIMLPTGVIMQGCEGAPIEPFLGLGTLAVAIETRSPNSSLYVPVRAIEQSQGWQVLDPQPSLTFEAPAWGQQLAQLDDLEVLRLLDGGAALNPEPFVAQFMHFAGVSISD